MDPVTMAAIGTAAGGVGQLLGGLGIGKKKTDNAYNIALQEQSSLRHERDSFNQKMALAKEHGLHPLSVLGVPSSNFSPAIMSDSGGTDFSAIGSGLERMAQTAVEPPSSAPSTPSANQQRLEDATIRQREADAKFSEWRALEAEWDAQDRARGVGRVGLPPAAVRSNDGGTTLGLAAAQAGVSPAVLGASGVFLKQDVLPPHPTNLGHGLGTDQGFTRVVDSNGNLISVPNSNLLSMDVEEPGTFYYLSNKYGIDKALKIMGVLEQAPVALGAIGSAGYAGAKVYKYFADQRRDALNRARSNRANQKWRGRGSVGSRNE